MAKTPLDGIKPYDLSELSKVSRDEGVANPNRIVATLHSYLDKAHCAGVPDLRVALQYRCPTPPDREQLEDILTLTTQIIESEIEVDNHDIITFLSATRAVVKEQGFGVSHIQLGPIKRRASHR